MNPDASDIAREIAARKKIEEGRRELQELGALEFPSQSQITQGIDPRTRELMALRSRAQKRYQEIVRVITALYDAT